MFLLSAGEVVVDGRAIRLHRSRVDDGVPNASSSSWSALGRACWTVVFLPLLQCRERRIIPHRRPTLTVWPE
jgi:hypothetical protein